MRLFAWCCFTVSFSLSVGASTLYWESATPAGNVWDTTTLQWHKDAPNGTLVAWNNANSDDAVFSANPAAISLNVPITASSMQFAVDGFSLQGAALTLAGGSGNIDVGNGVSALLAVQLGGTNGLTKTGGGTLSIARNGTYTGDTAVLSGTVKLGGGGPAFPSGAAAYYAFEDSGNLGVDSSGTGNNLLNSGAPAHSPNGKLGGALSLNGSSRLTQQVAFPTNVPIGASAYTVSAWIKPDPNPGAWGIVGWGAWGAFNSVNAFRTLTPNTLRDYWWSNDLDSINPGFPSFSGAWHHVLAVYDPALGTFQHKIYVDGALNVQRTVVTPPNAQAVNFNVGVTNNGEYFLGLIDELWIYPRALNASEIQSLYTGGAGDFIPDTSNVIVGPGATLDVAGQIETIGSLAGAGSSSVKLNGGDLTIGANNTTSSFAGVISGAGKINKTGIGSLTLSNANTYSGDTSIQAGIIALGSDAALPSGAGAGNITLAGALDLKGFSPTINGLSGTGTVLSSVAGSATISVGAGDASTTFSGTIQDGAGTVTLRKAGTGVLTLAGGNSYSGATIVSAGTLRLNGALPTAAWIADDIISGNGNPIPNWTDAISGKVATPVGNPPTLITGTLNGHNTVKFDAAQAHAFQVQGPDTPTSNATDFTVACVFRTGTPGVNGVGQWYQNTGLVDSEQPGVTNDWGMCIESTGRVAAGIGGPDVTIYAAASCADNFGHIAVYVHKGDVVTLAVDGVVISQATGAAAPRNVNRVLFGSMNAINYYTGEIAEVQMFNGALADSNLAALQRALGAKYGITVNAPGSGSFIPDNSPLTVAAGATFDVNGASETIASISGAAGSNLLLTGTLTVGDAQSTSFDGVIAGPGTLTKAGAGALTLSGANSYSGETRINAGTLLLPGAAAGSTFTVNSGAMLAGTGTAGPVNVAAGGILAPGNAGAGTLRTGSLTLNSNAVVNVDIGTASDQIVVTGNLTLGGTINIIQGAGFGLGDYRIFTYTGTLTLGTVNIPNSTEFEIAIDTATNKEVLLTVSKLVVKSIARAGNNPTNAASVDFTVTFGVNVTGVDASDFELTVTSGNITQQAITNVAQISPKVYTVRVNTGSGEGRLRLDLHDDNSIHGSGGAPLGGAAVGDGDFFGGEQYTIDRTRPAVTVNQAVAQNDPTQVQPVKFTVVFSEPMRDFTSDKVTIGGTAAPGNVTVTDSGDATTFTVAVDQLSTEGTLIASIAADAVADLAGNGNDASTSTDNSIFFDLATVAAVTSVTSTDDDGFYGGGTVVYISVAFSKAVFALGVPELYLNSGEFSHGRYESGSGTRTLTFSYSVSFGDASDDLDYAAVDSLILRNGATIRDASNVDAQLTLPAPGSANSLAGQKEIVIDTISPAVVDVSALNDDGVYGAGVEIQITVEFDEPVVVTGLPKLLLNVAGPAAEAVYASGSESDTLVFNYTVEPGQAAQDLTYASTTALVLNGGRITDLGGNNAKLALPIPGAAGSLGDNKDIDIDGIAPQILNVVASTANGTYGSGAKVNIEITFSKSVDVIGIPKLALDTTRASAAAEYAAGAGSTVLVFALTVAAGDTTGDLDYSSSTALSLDGGTISDALGNAADPTLPVPGGTGSLGANSQIVLNTVPTVTSITPAFGVAAGGTQVVIVGTNLDGATAQFGGSNALTLTAVPLRLTVATATHAEGTVDVIINGPGGSITATNAFTYVSAPTITSISPNAGPTAGGQTVALTGTSFVPGTAVAVGGTAATNVVVESSTRLTAQTPAHLAGTFHVQVTTPFAQSFTLNNAYTFNSPPSIASGPTVTPSLLAAQRPVFVSLTTSDPENDPVAISFDWGDGTGISGSPHTYAAAGTYTVTIILADLLNTVNAQQIQITVGGPATAMTVTKFAASMNFKTPGIDSCQVSGTLPGVAAGTFGGKVFHLDVGGAIVDFTLDAKGKAKTKTTSIALKAKLSKTGEFSGGAVPFQAKSKGALAANWLDEGVDPTKSAKTTINMTTDVLFGGKLYSSTDTLKLTTKAGVNGKLAK